MKKPRVHELASELGVEPRVALAKLKELGEFVKGPSSTLEPSVARKLRAALDAEMLASAPQVGVSGNPPATTRAASGSVAKHDVPSIPEPRTPRRTSTSIERTHQTIPPEGFVQPGHRLFIDTNVFMDTDLERAAGLRQLFERCKDAAIRNDNGVVVPSKVIDELSKQSRLDPTGLTEERVAAIRRAGHWLTALESASTVGLVRTELGDGSNPYADDLFVNLFSRFGDTFRMCLLTNDITLRLRIRLLSSENRDQLLVGTVLADGQILVDADQTLYERGVRKLARTRRQIEEGLGRTREQAEVDTLIPLLEEFRQAFTLETSLIAPQEKRAVKASAGQRSPGKDSRAFGSTTALKPKDQILGPTAIPATGDLVTSQSKHGRRQLVLGELLGEGGEGRVFAVQGEKTQVAKIFDAEHRTAHRLNKIELLLDREVAFAGIAFPSGLIVNESHEFVGYTMPRASGKELQATIMRPARFKKVYPNWTKADLVDVCISFLEKVDFLHSLNVLLGDINPKNLMVDSNKQVWIIDADSWQLEGYPCPVGTPMFTPASIAGDYAEALRSPEEESFAIATMLFMILITGQFPYARSGADGGDFAALIKDGKFPFPYGGPSDQDQPEGNWKFMWSHLPFHIKGLFWNTFHRDGQRYNNRPTASEWLSAFLEYRRSFGGPDDFDPMSNDVYPFRFKAFRPDTPISDCPQCQRRDAVIGVWKEEAQSYFQPELCYDCNQTKPSCAKCGKRKPSSALVYGGFCWDCYQKRDYANCSTCGRETPNRHLVGGLCSNCQLVLCSDCKTPTAKATLTYGRCRECEARRAMLDTSRRCARCGKPFITYGNVSWHQRANKLVPLSHKTSDPACVASTASNGPGMGPIATGIAKPGTIRSTPAKKSIWARVADWLWN